MIRPVSLVLPLLLPALPAQDAPQARTDAGLVAGATTDVDGVAVHAFLGVPFAAPPVGALRWRPPQPAAEWSEVRRCVDLPPACPQPRDFPQGFAFREHDEDCLYLNVWTAALGDDEPRPVMVWIHGGGNLIGGTATATYDGARFAAGGVVLVSIQYRLGVFGWLAHPALTAEAEERDGIAASGNYGLMDQLAALRWVRRNIAAFGGDPERVTIFGESAGATDVTLLMAAPAARGLFHRAIAQSGSFGEHMPSLEQSSGLTNPPAHRTGEQIARQFDIENDDDDVPARLRALSVEQLRDVPLALGSFGRLGNADRGERAVRLGPIVDGHVLPRSPEQVWREGAMHRVPFLAGSLLDDGSAFSRTSPIRGLGVYRLAVRALFGRDAGRVLRLFPAASAAEVPAAVHRLITVMSFTAPARRLCRQVDAAGGDAWLYHFSHRHGLARGDVPVVHGMELRYLFGTYTRFFDAGDRALGDVMRARWIAFAATGNPNPDRARPLWPRHDAESDRHLEFGTVVSVGAGLERAACDVFDAASARR